MDATTIPPHVFDELERQVIALVTVTPPGMEPMHGVVSAAPQFMLALTRREDAPKPSKAQYKKAEIKALARSAAIYMVEEDHDHMSGCLNRLAELTGWTRMEIVLDEAAVPTVTRSKRSYAQMSDFIDASCETAGYETVDGLKAYETDAPVKQRVQ
ncbi:hypothetical protein ACRBEV_25655 [Methylobacterium phyllosphaerae]